MSSLLRGEHKNDACNPCKAKRCWRNRPMNPAEKAWFVTEIEYLRECFALTPTWPSPLRLQSAERARFKAAVEEIKARFIQKFGRG